MVHETPVVEGEQFNEFLLRAPPRDVGTHEFDTLSKAVPPIRESSTVMDFLHGSSRSFALIKFRHTENGLEESARLKFLDKTIEDYRGTIASE